MNVCCFVNKVAIAAAIAGFAFGFGVRAMGADTVQVNIKSLLNARAVTTCSNGKLYTWTKGIDGGGNSDGYVTHSAAVHLNYTGHTLPDSARYPADSKHPLMILNFSNIDSTGQQTHYLSGSDSVKFSVPQGNYSNIYFAMTSSEGSSTIGVVLNYSDGPATSSVTLPDYDQGLASGAFYVDSGMQKWNNQNSPGDNYGHALNGFGVTTNPAKTLTSVTLKKTTTGSYLVLWGVTGVGTISILAAYPAFERTHAASVVVQSANGITRIANVKAGSTLTLYSPSGETAARYLCANSGIVSVGAGNGTAVKVAPGMYVCELRSGNDRQTIQMLVPR